MAMDDDDIFSSASRGWLFWSVLAGVITAIIVVLALVGCAARAHDDGRYATSPLKSWFNSLRSGKGPCCSDSDGVTVDDPDWGLSTAGGHPHYTVKLDGQWVDVPDDALITEPNKLGHTMVWPMYEGGKAVPRCFMPGSMT
jgi:hypothetical protein